MFTNNELQQILKALDGLHLQVEGGTYSTVSGAFDQTKAHEVAQKFFDALGRVGTSKFSIRIIQNGRDVHPSEFLNARTGDGLIDHVTVKDRVLYQHLQNGGTIVFDHVNDHVPFAQAIQEHVEVLTGGECWVQCYITQGQSSAFKMHQDTHAFVIAQIYGRKEWRHEQAVEGSPMDSIYEPGSIAFYPYGTLHDVYGLGELSMHLTISFQHQSDIAGAPAHGGNRVDHLRRRGSGLPFSLYPGTITSDTSARLALRHLPRWDIKESLTEIYTGSSTVAVPTRYMELLRELALSPSTTPRVLSARFDMSLEDVMSLYRFGFENGLLFTGIS